MKNLAFHSLLRWKIILLPILTTSLIHFSLKGWENVVVLFEHGSERANGHKILTSSEARSSWWSWSGRSWQRGAAQTRDAWPYLGWRCSRWLRAASWASRSLSTLWRQNKQTSTIMARRQCGKCRKQCDHRWHALRDTRLVFRHATATLLKMKWERRLANWLGT